jgi:hypothetical protein
VVRVAYDPYAQDGDTLQQLIARYKPLNKLPYYELFTPMDSTKDNLANWNTQGKTYSRFLPSSVVSRSIVKSSTIDLIPIKISTSTLTVSS